MSAPAENPAAVSWEAQVKGQIRRRYEGIAVRGFEHRTGAERALAAGYTRQFMESLPGAVADAYCGCGHPLADGVLAGLDLGRVRIAVDLGCGAGIDTRLLAGLLEPQSLVIGLDMTPGMLALAGVGPVRTMASDMEALALADGVADLVIANASFNLTTDKRTAFTEAYRILKPGGRLAARDLIRDGDLPPELMEDPQAWNTSLGGVLEKKELLAAMTEAGFFRPRISGHQPFGPVTSVRLEAVKPE